MPQVSFEFLQTASLSRRRHGFDSRTGRQYCQSFKRVPFRRGSNRVHQARPLPFREYQAEARVPIEGRRLRFPDYQWRVNAELRNNVFNRGHITVLAGPISQVIRPALGVRCKGTTYLARHAKRRTAGIRRWIFSLLLWVRERPRRPALAGSGT